MGVATHQQVVQHRRVFEQFDILEGARNAHRGDLMRRRMREIAAFKEYLSRSRRVEAADEVEDRGLARTVGANEGEHFAFSYIKADAIDSQHAAETHAQVLGRQKNFTHDNLSDFWNDFCRLNMPLR